MVKALPHPQILILQVWAMKLPGKSGTSHREKQGPFPRKVPLGAEPGRLCRKRISHFKCSLKSKLLQERLRHIKMLRGHPTIEISV